MTKTWARAAFALTLALATTVTACSDDHAPDMTVNTWFRWNKDPSSLDDIGYQVSVDVGWPSRADTCFAFWPGLHVTVNDREARSLGEMGDCRWDILFEPPVIKQDGPVTVRVLDGDRLMGEAIYDGVFPGFGALLASPSDGNVRQGAPIEVSIPDGFPAIQFPSARFYWRNTPEDVPPYSTFSSAEVSANGRSVTTTAPGHDGQTGPAALIIEFADGDTSVTTSCTGFTYCYSLLQRSLGPIEVEVLPPE